MTMPPPPSGPGMPPAPPAPGTPTAAPTLPDGTPAPPVAAELDPANRPRAGGDLSRDDADDDAPKPSPWGRRLRILGILLGIAILGFLVFKGIQFAKRKVRGGELANNVAQTARTDAGAAATDASAAPRGNTPAQNSGASATTPTPQTPAAQPTAPTTPVPQPTPTPAAAQAAILGPVTAGLTCHQAGATVTPALPDPGRVDIAQVQILPTFGNDLRRAGWSCRSQDELIRVGTTPRWVDLRGSNCYYCR